MIQDQIPLSFPQIEREEKEAVLSVLESGWLTYGEYNQNLEEDFTRFIGVKHAITMNSCTSALELNLKVHGITGEVIIPSFSFIARANVVVNDGVESIKLSNQIMSDNTKPNKKNDASEEFKKYKEFW